MRIYIYIYIYTHTIRQWSEKMKAWIKPTRSKRSKMRTKELWQSKKEKMNTPPWGKGRGLGKSLHFTKKVQMANGRIKGWLSSLAIKEFQIKTMRFFFCLILAKMKNNNKPYHWERAEKMNCHANWSVSCYLKAILTYM